MAKKKPDSIRLKDFSEEDYKMLNQILEITRENVYTRGVMKACYAHLDLIKEHQQVRAELYQMKQKLENIKSLLRVQEAAKQELEQADKELSELFN